MGNRAYAQNGLALPVDGGFMAGIASGQIDPRSLMANAA